MLGRERAKLSAGPSAEAAAALSGWFRPEAPELARKPGPATAVVASRPVDRVLVGGVGGADTEARIRFGRGALAGAEIRLQCPPGGRAVEVELLTATAGSRHTLSLAMEEVRRRLQRKGIEVSPRRPGAVHSGDKTDTGGSRQRR
jgi:hypothetical protein